MNRREALSKIGLLLGGTIIGSNAFLMGYRPGNRDLANTFTPENLKLLNEVGEVIVPATNTAGAKAANVAGFMQTIVNDFYTDEEQQIFASGIESLKRKADEKFHKSFMSLTSNEKQALLLDLEKESAGTEGNRHYYIMMKQLTIWGFLSSEVAAKEVFNHAPVPGYYDPCVNYEAGDKALFPRSGSGEALHFAKFHQNSQGN